MTEPDSEPENDIPETMLWMMELDTDDLYGCIMAPNNNTGSPLTFQTVSLTFLNLTQDISKSSNIRCHSIQVFKKFAS